MSSAAPVDPAACAVDHVGDIAFTESVQGHQRRRGSLGVYRRMREDTPAARGLGPDEAAFLAERDGFYLAMDGEGGWPYVHHRGSRPDPEDGRGFVVVLTGAGRRALRRAAPVYLKGAAPVHLKGIERHFASHLTSGEAAAVTSALKRVVAIAP